MGLIGVPKSDPVVLSYCLRACITIEPSKPLEEWHPGGTGARGESHNQKESGVGPVAGPVVP